jgi:DUF1680 family protein
MVRTHALRFCFLVLWLGLTIHRGHAADAAVHGGRRALDPLNYRGVTLDGGPLRFQLDEVREAYLRIPNDDLLKGFRQRAGLPAPGEGLGGWYTADTFHIFGQVVSGLARLYATTGEPACRAKANALVAEWARCIAPDGYFSYSDYNPYGGVKRLHPEGWTCCAGTRPQAVAEVVDLIYFGSSTSLYVNLYIPSTLRLKFAGGPVTVCQTTRFPAEDSAYFAVATPKPVAFELKLRAPAWLAGLMTVSVNGQTVAAREDDQHWLVVSRTWKDGDSVRVGLPLALQAVVLDSRRGYPAAGLYGPVAVAFRSTNASFVTNLDLIRLRVLAEKSDASKDRYLNVAGFEIID